MNQHHSPWLNIDQGASNSGQYLGPSQKSKLAYSAVLGGRVILRPYKELKGFKWAFSGRDHYQEILGRQVGLLEILYSIAQQIRTPCKFSLRFVQEGEGKPLLIYFCTKVESRTKQGIEDIAEGIWTQIRSAFPYDYALKSLTSEDELLEAFITHPMYSTSVLYPFIGSYRVLIRDIKSNNRSLIFGYWKTTSYRMENVIRSLHQMPQRTVMDILIQPTLATRSELNYLSSTVQWLSNVNSSDSSFSAAYPNMLLEEMSRRRLDLHKAFLCQIRLYSEGDSSLVSRCIANALSSGPTLDGISFPRANVAHPKNGDFPEWVERVNQMDFIPIQLALTPPLQRMPFLATLSEVNTVFRLPILPEAGIPDLEFEYIESDILEELNVL